MKTSLVIAALAVVGAGAIGAGATFAIQPFVGSDTEYEIQNQALVNTGLGNAGDYSGGGSGGAENAMTGTTAVQLIGPMSKMMTTTTCKVQTGTRASGIALGLDAVNVYSSVFAGGASACNGTADHTGAGLNYDAGIQGQATPAFQNWTDMLALLYGGLDKSTGIADCGSAARKALVTNWSNLFQTQSTCSNGVSTCTSATFNSTTKPTGGFSIGGQLWHAFRRDDNSGTSDVFATLLGLGKVTATDSATSLITANVSSSGNHGFGASPYCNVINWETRAAVNGTTCTGGPGKQFLGPGGVPQGVCQGTTTLCSQVGATNTCPVDGTTCGAVGDACTDDAPGAPDKCAACNCVALDTAHKRPPYLTWGTVPDSGISGTVGAAVLPTSYQDNDPIRRPCIGKAAALTTNPGEEVCNRDGTLGVVLPIPPVDFVARPPFNRNPFVTAAQNACGGNTASTTAFNVFKCALRAGAAGLSPSGCASGGVTSGGGCYSATSLADNTNTLCFASPNDNQALDTYGVYDGRVYNLTLTDGSNGYTSFTIPSVPISLAFTGHYGRIHSQTVLWDKTAGSTGLADKGTLCQQQDATDQIGCLVQADPCSVGFAGDNGKTWGARANPVVASNNAALRIQEVASTQTTIQNGAYFGWRKIYLNSSGGFDQVASIAAGDAAVSAELSLAQYESNSSSILSLLTSTPGGFFGFGPSAPNGPDTPFCEDYNEQMLCDAGITNGNSCTNNNGIAVVVPAGQNAANYAPIPGNDGGNTTTCGNGTKERFEDCDLGATLNGQPGQPCTATCRFVFP